MKNIYIHKDPKHAAQQFVASWLQIGQGLVGVLTLGFVLPSWAYAYTLWLLLTDRSTHRAKPNIKVSLGRAKP